MIPLGYAADSPHAFGFDKPNSTDGELITYDGDAPLTIIAPTGSGKGVSCLIPMLLSYEGPMIVIDLKGELSAVTARARREMGQSVHILDPFGITGHVSDRLNPFDLFQLEGSMLEPDAEMLTALLGDGHSSEREPFWADTASGLCAGLIAYIAWEGSLEERNMQSLRDMLADEDVDYHLAVVLDGQKDLLPPFVYGEIAGYLQHASQQTRPSVLSTARTFMRALSSHQVTDCMRDSTISLLDVVEGKPQTIYLTIPPEKLKSHRCLLRCWAGTLLTAMMRRKEIPEKKTLFVFDEVAQLGTFDPLLTVTTLLRGYGVQLVSVWQDLAQMKSHYPTDWPSLLNNSGVLMSFGHAHYSACKQYSEVVGLEPSELMRMGQDEATLSVRGEGARKIRRMNYLRDEMFRGRYDANPFYRRKTQGR